VHYTALYNGKRLVYSFFDRTGVMTFQDRYPDYDTEERDGEFLAQIQRDTNDTVYLRIITPDQKTPIGTIPALWISFPLFLHFSSVYTFFLSFSFSFFIRIIFFFFFS
jgi:hypothetical protein